MNYKLWGKRILLFNPIENKIQEAILPRKKEDRKPRKKFRIGVIIDTPITIPPTAGVPYRLYYLSKELAKSGYPQVWFIANRNFQTTKELELIKNDYIRIYIIPPRRFYNISFMCALVQKEHIDILQFEDALTFLSVGLPLKQKLTIPIVVEAHDIEPTLRKALGKKRDEVELVRFTQYLGGYYSDATIAMTPKNQQELVEEIGIPKQKIFLVPNGVDATTNYTGINAKENILVYLGNIFYPPNLEAVTFLIKEILPDIKKQVPDVCLKVIGAVPKKLQKKYKTKREIKFIGEVRKREFLSKELKTSTLGLATVFVASGMKIKILDYSVNGLPIIATPIVASGYPQIKSLIISKPNRKSIVRAILKTLNNKKKLIKIGKQNRKFILTNYSWSKVLGELIRAYEFAYNLARIKSHQIQIPKPLWLQEERHHKKVLTNLCSVDKRKIKSRA